MNKKILTTVLAVCMFGLLGQAKADLTTLETLTGYDFHDERAFADTGVAVEMIGGSPVYNSPTTWWSVDDTDYGGGGGQQVIPIFDALSDLSVTTMVAYTGNITTAFDAYTVLGFTDNVVANGPGDDLVIFTVATTQDYEVRLSILGTTASITPQIIYAGLYQDLGGLSGYELTAATVDLSDFGLGGWEIYNQIQIDMVPQGSGAVVALVGYLHATPAPGAILLGGMGIGLVGWLRRRRAL